jgi:hypothetical protein
MGEECCSLPSLTLVIAGMIQAWVFGDAPAKPPLYDWLEPLPIWPLWMMLLVPLAVLVWPLRLLGVDVMGGSPWLFMSANLIYFYLLSCLVVAGLAHMRGRWRSGE